MVVSLHQERSLSAYMHVPFPIPRYFLGLRFYHARRQYMPVVTLTVADTGRNLLRDSLSGVANPKITYFAIGSGTTAPTIADTKLQTETFRKKVTSFTNGGSAGEILINVYVASGDAVNADIEEIGVFGGSSATNTPNSREIGRASCR